MTVKELITELSKYDENLEVCLTVNEDYCGETYGDYEALMNNIYIKTDNPYYNNLIILFGYTSDFIELQHKKFIEDISNI